MDSNGIISFQVGDKKYTACFGMKFKYIFGSMLTSHNGDCLAIDWFTYQLYAGLCNECYLNRQPYPEFRDVVALVEEIFDSTPDLQKRIYECYENSKAGQEIEKLLKEANEQKKSESESENPSAEKSELANTSEIGEKLAALPTES